MKSTWNPDVKPGDRLAVQQGGLWRALTVERITPTVVVCDGGSRLTRATGKVQGSSWDSSYAQPITQEIEAELEAQRLRFWAEREAPRHIAALSPAGIKQVRALVRSIWNTENMPAKPATES
jgi:hypothetical protein